MRKIAQKLPQDLDHKVTSFHRFIIGMRQKQYFPLSNIGNMYETPMNFDMINNRRVQTKSVKTVQVRSTGNETTMFTVALTCMADDTKLKPMAVFKRKIAPKIKFPPGISVHFHEETLMDKNGITMWMGNVWHR
jgi:hypothetical protein